MATVDIGVNDKATGTLKRIKQSFKDTEKAIIGTNNASKRLNSSLLKMAGAFAGAYLGFQSLKGVASLGSDFITTASKFEGFETTLRSISGSSEEAKSSLKWIQDFGSKTPYTIDKVTESFVKMKANGLDPTDGTLTALGNASSAMGKDITQAVEAMADAVTGENERLKEFGIKASKTGDTIKYAWSDSSGKMREVVINNNKDMIQSTLNTIFNEKYVGAMDAQSKTWAGMMSNISDSWTIFQKDVMDEGLFTYLKGILSVVKDELATAFGDAKDGASGWSDYIISGIKSMILGFGNLYDVWNGIGVAFDASKVAFFGIVYGITEGVNKLGEGFDIMGVSIQNTFKMIFDAIGQAFVDVVNEIIDGINAVTQILPEGYNPFSGMEIEALKFTSAIEEAKRSTEDLIDNSWSESNLNKAIADLKEGMESAINEDGLKRAEKAIRDIDTAVSKLNATEASGADAQAKAKQKAKEELEKLLKNQAGLSGVANDKKVAKAKAKALEKANREAVSQADRTADQIVGIFSNVLGDLQGGGVSGAVQGVLDNMLNGFMSNFQSSVSESLSAVLQGDGDTSGGAGGLSSLGIYGAMASGAIALIGAFTKKSVSELELKEAEGITTVLSDSVSNSIAMIEENGTTGLSYSKQMVESLKKIEILSDSSASNIGSDLRGENYIDMTELGFWNDESKELVASGVKLHPATLTELKDGILVGNKYMTELITNSGWLGIGSGTELKTTDLGVAGADITDPIAQAYVEGVNALRTAFVSLGGSADSFDQLAEDWTTSLNNLNFAGKSQEEVAEMINGAIGADLDNLAGMLSEVAPYMDELKYAGEGQAETLIRLANEYEVVGRAMRNVGLVLPSVANGGLRVADAMIKASGGMNAFNAGMDAFISGFYTDAEQVAMAGDNLRISMADMGLVMPATAQGFRDMMEMLMQTNADLAGQLLGLVGDADTYYNGMERVTGDFNYTVQATADIIEEIKASLIDIAGLKKEWTGGVKGATNYLNAVVKDTGLKGITYDTFLEAFTEASKDGLSADDLSDWQNLSTAIKGVQTAEMELLESRKDFYDDLLNTIETSYTGKLSYLNTWEKSEYLGRLADQQKEAGDVQSYLDTLYKKLGTELTTSTTKEEYIPKFNEYIEQLKSAEPEANLDDVVSSVKEVKAEIEDLKDTISTASFQN